MQRLRSLLTALACVALSACAAQGSRPASTDVPPPEKPTWAFEASDVPVDPAFRFGVLPNGMRYAIRQNATPKGVASVRMEVSAGSLDESDTERGFAHFVEHMAFNGSTNVPEGEMVRLLERKGLAFGADTNAQTSFDRTTYMLDLPRNDADLLDTALMLMRETASELTISQDSIARERGVILAEMRDRNSWQLRNLEDSMAFFNPASLYARRLPIGTTETLNAATAETLRAFWKREYVPKNTTVIVVGDYPADKVEDAIKARFQTWGEAPAEPMPDAGPVKIKDKGRTDIYIDPAMSERVTASRNGVWLDEPDSVAQRQENLLREIGYGIINRRFQRVSRQADPPFRGAGFGTGDTFKSGRTTNLIVDTVDGKWRRGFEAVVEEYRRAMDQGFSTGEVAEQVANIRAGALNAAAGASTRGNGALVNAVFSLIRADMVPATPQSALERLEIFVPQITPERVLAALKREAVPLKDPLIRFQGRREPEGGAKALRKAWKDGMRGKLDETAAAPPAGFAYTDFGAPGIVASDVRDPMLDIREVRFENGVRLNLKRTDIEQDRVSIQLSIDGGDLLNTRDAPLVTEMASFLPYGGLGKHSQDELQSILAGRTVGTGFDATPESFVSVAETTPRDLELQLQLMAAGVTDPGYRPEGEVRYRLNINNFFAQKNATPGSALSNSIGGILSDDDPRFTLQKVEDYRKLTFAKLKADISDRLAKGAMEIGVVGDIDEAATIALVAKTFGALPPREADFQPYELQRKRPFTAERTRRVVRHTGPADQSIIRLTWPTRDGSDPQESLALEVLERVVRIELTETLREKLGKAYSPSAASTTSLTWRGYGTFTVAASVELGEVNASRAAIVETLKTLRDTPISDDELQRARQPLLEGLDNALKTNGGWMTLVDRAQTEADRIDRQLQARTRLLIVSPVQVQELAKKYLQMKDAVEILVLPEGAPVPKG